MLHRSLTEYARDYSARGYALARLKAGEKRPGYKNWTQSGFSPEGFSDGDNIGIQAGALSGDLVCVDLDSADAVAKADAFLPPTSMVDGRPGKPRSHRWYRVENIPPEMTAEPHVAGGIGGPRTFRRFRHAESKQTIVDFLGTGSQAVVPPSVWVSKDGARTEVRIWHSDDGLPGQPAVVDCRQLYEAVCNLAEACGWCRPKASAGKTCRKGRPATVPQLRPRPGSEVAAKARNYVRKMEPAVEGQGGDAQTYKVARVLVIDFSLSIEEALPIMEEYSDRCVPPWTEEALLHKLEMADALDDERGIKVRNRKRDLTIDLKEGVIVVGPDVAGPWSYIQTNPSLYAAMVMVEKWRLAPELDAIDWEDKEVLLASPSTVATNSRVVLGEFYLARLLRERGADVRALRLPPAEGRRQTLGEYARRQKATLVDVVPFVVVPPRASHEAHANAEEASALGKALDKERKALPRKKPSPKLMKAFTYLRDNAVLRLTKEVLGKARKKGITPTTLRRALRSSKSTPNTSKIHSISPHTL